VALYLRRRMRGGVGKLGQDKFMRLYEECMRHADAMRCCLATVLDEPRALPQHPGRPRSIALMRNRHHG